MSYRAPTGDILFVMKELAGIDAVAMLPGYEGAGLEMASAVLAHCAKLAEGVVAALDDGGERHPTTIQDGRATCTPGFTQAVRERVAGAWQGLRHSTALGGRALPKLVRAACQEVLSSASLSIGPCPLLTDGAVGVQAVAVAERAYQKAVAYARERIQSSPLDRSLEAAAPISHQPDVRRMLSTMRAFTEGCRAVALVAAALEDSAHANPDPDARRRDRALHDFLVPLVKGLSTEMSMDVAHLGVQVHGGIGDVEGGGAPQLLRGARALTESGGTTAIQADDLVRRRTLPDGGATARALAAHVKECEAALRRHGDLASLAVSFRLGAARRAFSDVVECVVEDARPTPDAPFPGSVAYLMVAGELVVGWQLARALLAAEKHLAQGRDAEFMRAKIVTARFFADHVLSQAPSLRDRVVEGAARVVGTPVECF